MSRRGFNLSSPEDFCATCPYNGQKKVFGHGSPTAKLMIISASPTVVDESKGKLFQSSADQILIKELKSAGIKPDEVYFKSLVQCRPPVDEFGKQKEPPAEAINCCDEYLKNEIERIKPVTLVLLGKVPLKVILGRTKATKSRGLEYPVPGYSFQLKAFPTFDLQSVVDNPELTPHFREHLKQAYAGTHTREIEDPLKDCVYEICDTEEKANWLLRRLIEVKEFTFDLETHGLRPDGQTDILSIGFSWESKKGYCLPLYHPECPFTEKQLRKIIAGLKVVLENPKTLKIGHNAKFDCKFLSVELGINVANFMFDTMLAHYTLEERQGTHDLKSLVARFCQMPGYSLVLEDWVDKNRVQSYRDVPYDMLMRYCAADADATWRLYQYFKTKVDIRLLRFLMNASDALLAMETTGVKLDTSIITEMTHRLKQETLEIDKKIKEAVGNKNFNPNSTVELQDLLFNQLKLPVFKRGKKGASVDKNSLDFLKGKSPIVDLILAQRQPEKLLSTYLEPARRLMAPDGRLYTEFLLHGTVTGRLASKDPNLQNVPVKGAIKNIFTADDGYLFIQADYSQAELRVLAMLSKDPEMCKAFREGRDIHVSTASGFMGVAPESVTKEQRRAAKCINFGLLYGMGAKKLAADIGVTEKEAEKLMTQYFLHYKNVKKYMDKAIDDAKRIGHTLTPTGRKRHLQFGRDGGAERQAMNTAIQSLASDFTLLAIIRILRMIRTDYKYGDVRLCLTVHDSILVEAKRHLVEEVATKIKRIMEYPDWSEFGYTLDMQGIIMQSDLEVGKSWGDLFGWSIYKAWVQDKTDIKFEEWAKNIKGRYARDKIIFKKDEAFPNFDNWFSDRMLEWEKLSEKASFSDYVMDVYENASTTDKYLGGSHG